MRAYEGKNKRKTYCCKCLVTVPKETHSKREHKDILNRRGQQRAYARQKEQKTLKDDPATDIPVAYRDPKEYLNDCSKCKKAWKRAQTHRKGEDHDRALKTYAK